MFPVSAQRDGHSGTNRSGLGAVAEHDLGLVDVRVSPHVQGRKPKSGLLSKSSPACDHPIR